MMRTKMRGLRVGHAVLLAVRLAVSGGALIATAAWAEPTAMVSLPGAGQPTMVEEQRYPEGLHQSIRFGRDGEGAADLTLGVAGTRGGPLPGKPTRYGIAAELAGLPGGPYRVSRQRVDNAYGQVGVAVGGRCVFAWQWIDNVGKYDAARSPAGTSRLSASLRVHRCGGVGSTQDLITDITRLHIGIADRRQRPARRVPRRVRRSPHPPIATSPAPGAPSGEVDAGRMPISLPSAAQSERVPVPDRLHPMPTAVPRPAATKPVSSDQRRYLTEMGPPS